MEDISELIEIKHEDLISYEMPFNLADMFQQYFLVFKGNYKGIIRSIHAVIAKDNQGTSVQNEDALNYFEKQEYQIDFK